MKKIISLAIVCVMMLGMLSMVSFAAPAAIGESTTTWEITGTTLTIGGTGAMPTMAKADYPWNANRETITEVVVTDGVTEIGKEAFASCPALTKVTFGKDVTILKGDCIGYNGALTTIVFKGKITEIAQGVVYGSGAISSVTLAADQTWEDFEAVATVNNYNTNFFSCIEYVSAKADAFTNIEPTIAAYYGKIENWGGKTYFIVGLGSSNNDLLYSLLKSGFWSLKVILADETASKTYTIEEYNFANPDSEFYATSFLRLALAEYGIPLDPTHSYTLKVAIVNHKDKVVATGVSETGAFTSTQGDTDEHFLKAGAIVPNPVPYTSTVEDGIFPAPVEPDTPVQPPKNGDATVFAVVFAAVAVLGMAVVVTKKVHA